MASDAVPVKPVFDRDKFFAENYQAFCALVNKRKYKWRATSVMEFEDVASILLTRIYQQLHHYDPTRPLDRWTNTLISHAMMSMLRDHVYKDARPCISGQAPGFNMGSSYGRGCACNLGGDKCSWTKSGLQDGSCKFYAAWSRKRKAKLAISSPLSLEFHGNESQSMPDDSFDIEAAKKVIDDNIQRRLTKDEYRIYVMLFVQHLSTDEVVKQMGFKKRDKKDMKAYMHIRGVSVRLKEVVKQIVSEQGLIR